jgi:spermidine synthase
VEIDDGLDEIAERFFGLRSDPRLRLIHTDGRQYLDGNQQPYDMIVLDAFMHASTPNELTSNEAAQAYRNNLTSDGLFARNVISAYLGEAAAPLHQQARYLDDLFEAVEIFPASNSLPLGLPQNLLLVARVDKLRSIDGYLPYAALPRE